MASSYLVSVPKLKGRENYEEWAFAAENFLILEGLSKSIEETVDTREATTSTPEQAAEDAKARAKLILTIDPKLYVHIRGSKNTRELWMTLKKMFDDSGFSRRISLLRHLISTRLVNCDSMGSYVTQVVETAQRLRGTGFNIDDEWIGSLLLAGLPDKFMPMIMAIEHSGIAITSDSIKTKLLDMEGDEVDSAGNAFYFKNKGAHYKPSTYPKKTGSAGGSHVSKSDSNARREIQCYKCKQN